MRLIAEVLERPPLKLGAMLGDTPSLAQYRIEDEAFVAAIRHQIYRGDTLLHVAAAGLRADAIPLLLGAGGHVDARNRNGATALHYASDARPDSDLNLGRDDVKQTIDALISGGASPDTPDKLGVRPLHRAVRKRNVHAVSALLARGANVNAPNGRSGSTPLHLAVVSSGASGTAGTLNEQVEIVALLIQAGADSAIANALGQTARSTIRSPSLLEALAREGLLV